jgi:catechol 2,3-dioxygenase-like lactoylglutathione lyase family enzyme
MKLQTLILTAILLGCAALAEAQSKFGSRFDHVSLVTPDVAGTRQWYLKHLGGKEGQRPDHVWYGSTWILIILPGTPGETLPPGQKAQPIPSAGGALDHLAFSVPDVESKVKELEAAGVKIVSRPRSARGWYKAAFIEDPNGVSIELLEDRSRVGFHHIHLRTPSPEVETNWFIDTFGGARTKIRDLDALDYGEMKLIVERDPNAKPSYGHAIEHLCFVLPKLDELLNHVRAKGTKITMGPVKYGNPTVSGDMVFFDSPTGTRFEVLTRTPDYVAPK